MESMKISIISRLSQKKLRPYRLGFTQYLVENYGMSSSTAYPKIRKNRMKRWEVVGIAGCVKAFMPEYDGKLCDFYEGISCKGKFLSFMSEMGMSDRTARDRFREFDFTEVEIKGMEKIFQEYKKTMEEKE